MTPATLIRLILLIMMVVVLFAHLALTSNSEPEVAPTEENYYETVDDPCTTGGALRLCLPNCIP